MLQVYREQSSSLSLVPCAGFVNQEEQREHRLPLTDPLEYMLWVGMSALAYFPCSLKWPVVVSHRSQNEPSPSPNLELGPKSLFISGTSCQQERAFINWRSARSDTFCVVADDGNDVDVVADDDVFSHYLQLIVLQI